MAITTYTIPAEKIIHNTSVDFSSRFSIINPIHIVQYDNSLPIISVELKNNNKAYVLPSNIEVWIRWKKPDNTFVRKQALGCNSERNTIYFEITQQMVMQYGLFKPVVELIIPSDSSDPSVASSGCFSVLVDRNPIQNGDIESMTEYEDPYKNVCYTKTEVDTALASKSDKSTTLFGYGITDGENIGNKVSVVDFQNLSKTDYPNITALYNYHTNYVDPCYDNIDNLENNKADKATVDTALTGKLDNTTGSVTTDNIANKAVTNEKIANYAITAMKIANNAVSGSNIAQNQISTNHLQSGVVTNEKLNDDVKDMLYMTSTQNWVNALVGTAKTGGFFFDSTGKKIVTNKYSGALISVKGGDKIKVSARTSSASPYLVTFYSDYTYVEGTSQGESYTFLEGYGIASTDYNDEEITVPVEAKYAGVNSYITGDTAIPLSVYKLSDIVYDTPVKSAVKNKLNNSAGAVGTDNIANGAITKLKLADDVRTKLQEVVDTLPKCMVLPEGDNTRALYVDGRYLYHCHATNRAVTKCDISIETDPQNIKTIGGHAKTYPRGMAVGNGYLYVPYRDMYGGTRTSFGDEDVGGYLDTINLSDFSVTSTITYPREPYDPGDGRGTRYYGKSHNAATYNDKYLCVTQQLGGWLLYDISENPVIDDKVKPLYKCDNRAQSTIDNTEFQQPAFYTDGTTVYLAITGYDRHLLKIYNLNDPTYPICVYSGDLRELWQHGNTAYLHTMGLSCQYPYIYCTVAPFPDSETVKYSTDFENTMQGVAVVDVSDINRVKVTFHKIPDESRTINSGGEPSPQSVSVTKNHLVMDMFDKGISVWSLSNPAEPKFLGNLDTGATKVCSVLSTEDGRTFIGTEYQGGNLTMYRGI